MLMSRKVFEPVGCSQDNIIKHVFEDSGGKLYCFPHDGSEENNPPGDDSDDSLCDDSDAPFFSAGNMTRYAWSGTLKAFIFAALAAVVVRNYKTYSEDSV